ncbi:Rieske 2Fe-2S domain-containing protein [Telmatospirillum siberiense]|uniref:Rieske domain-containing protein n=1 Tax=Telmatospirillum siberiense TaxID=382514 RepID=A0A2N3Q0U6_9PROT|nr:Rieske 2Fe-2S domain-containing protein [Telmatospirillum siberiense]PKU26280.1 hypothetical protein CWS72_00015 [Telmatospirillum siberiense]
MEEEGWLAVEHVRSHLVRGEQRWTGQVVPPGGNAIDILILALRSGLLAVRNRCPHRDVALLLGRLDETAGILECPSHGWELPLAGTELRGAPVIERDGKFFMGPHAFAG